jgi:hypothetical protein
MANDTRRTTVATLLAAVIAMLFPVAGAALDLDPEEACSALADAGLPTRGGYSSRRDGTFRCDSRRRTIVAGEGAQDEIRFSALGTEQAVEELRLVLTVRSRGNVQRAHRRLAEYAGGLAQDLLQTTLPQAVTDAILSAVSGSWESNGLTFGLRRSTVADGLYALRLSIR